MLLGGRTTQRVIKNHWYVEDIFVHILEPLVLHCKELYIDRGKLAVQGNEADVRRGPAV